MESDGNPMESVGTPTESYMNPMESCEKPMESFLGILWDPMRLRWNPLGLLWNPMGIPWSPMGIQWNPMEALWEYNASEDTTGTTSTATQRPTPSRRPQAWVCPPSGRVPLGARVPPADVVRACPSSCRVLPLCVSRLKSGPPGGRVLPAVESSSGTSPQYQPQLRPFA